jgi:SAM-dependent methyltransferase
MSRPNPFSVRYRDRPDTEWLTALLASQNDSIVDSLRFPEFPDKEVQRRTHGNSSDVAIRGSYQFYRRVKQGAVEAGHPFEPSRTLLDFGSGWGRTVRPFMREFELTGMYGAEPDIEMCEIARKLNFYLPFINSNYTPPLPLAENTFDYITSYSVFSHLPDNLFLAWMGEFARLLKPGGLLFFTTLGLPLIEGLMSEQTKFLSGSEIHFWHKILIEGAGDLTELYRRYREGEFVFLRTHAHDTYGDSFVPPAAVRALTRGKLELLAHDPHGLSQDLFVMRA